MNLNIIGHTKNKNYLEKAWEFNKLPHSLLFSGPKSVGKFSLAINLACQLLINDNINFSSKILDKILVEQIKNFIHPSLLVIGREGPKEITVDEIRSIGKFLSLSAAMSKYRIVIIDNADNMNLNAQNALLKILEEPPKNSLIIIINHSLDKLLMTIRSRTIKSTFTMLTSEEIKKIIDTQDNKIDILVKLGFNLSDIQKWITYNLFEIYQLLLDFIINQINIFDLAKNLEEIYKKKKLEFLEILSIISFINNRIVSSKPGSNFIDLVENELKILTGITKKYLLHDLFLIQSYVSDLILNYQEFNLDSKGMLILVLAKYKELGKNI